jgi:hypothetical protein
VPQPAKPRAESSPPVKPLSKPPSKPPSTHTVHQGLGDNLPAPAKNRAEALVPKHEDHKYEAPASTIPLHPPRSREITVQPVTPAAPPPDRERPRSVERPHRQTQPRRTGPHEAERPRVPPLLIVAVVVVAVGAAAIYLLRPAASHRADAVESVDAG